MQNLATGSPAAAAATVSGRGRCRPAIAALAAPALFSTFRIRPMRTADGFKPAIEPSAITACCRCAGRALRACSEFWSAPADRQNTPMTSLAPTAAGTMLVASAKGAPKPELVTNAVVSFLGVSEPEDSSFDRLRSRLFFSLSLSRRRSLRSLGLELQFLGFFFRSLRPSESDCCFFFSTFLSFSRRPLMAFRKAILSFSFSFSMSSSLSSSTRPFSFLSDVASSLPFVLDLGFSFALSFSFLCLSFFSPSFLSFGRSFLSPFFSLSFKVFSFLASALSSDSPITRPVSWRRNVDVG
mmetsp:Transcript_57534/g.134772  ORF Transcript_57534/g.134772 Transcript_57534/m.134772 type:complete len:297 (+) Transcript_57534:300-1190(+)